MADPVPELDARFSAPDARPTPWSLTRSELMHAELFHLSTVRADGRPHVTPLPAVWHDNLLHFCTGATEQKAVNLASDPRCVLATGSNLWKSGIDVVVEGRARRITDDELLGELAHAWFVKYDGDWVFEVNDGTFVGEGGPALVFAVDPTKILAFTKGDFAQTRYRF